jgi:hypothetical protein
MSRHYRASFEDYQVFYAAYGLVCQACWCLSLNMGKLPCEER